VVSSPSISRRFLMNAYPKAIDALMSLKDTDYRQIVIELAKKNPAEFCRIVEASQHKPDPVTVEITAMLKAEPNRWIYAIKRHRELTGAGLKEAKEFVESLMFKLGIEKNFSS
jgi:ribosomal protein L7/L12